MKNEYGLWKKDWKKRVGALALCAGMIITGTSVAGAQEHPQFTADQTEIRLAKEELQTVQLSYRGIFEGVLEEQTRGD